MDTQPWKRPRLHDFRIGTLNVKTLYKASALKTLTDTLERYKVHIVALQQTKWLGKGGLGTGNMSFMYGGIINNKHENEVGFVVHRKLVQWIKEFRAINNRICYIWINMEY